MDSFRILTTLAVLIGMIVAPNSAAYVARSSSSLAIFEALPKTPQGWTKLDAPDPASKIRLRIALHEPDADLFEKTLFAISDPSHESYGKHLKREQVKALIKPRAESTEAVLNWLQTASIADYDIENDGEWINFWATVSKANEMLDTTFDYFTHDVDASHTKKIRTLQYSAPLSVSPHIAMIQPTTRFGQLKPEGRNAFIISGVDTTTEFSTAAVPNTTVDPSCDTTITPTCLRALYNVGDYRADSRQGSLFGICGYLHEYAKYDGLDKFLRQYAPYARSQTFNYVKINGGLDTQNDTTYDDIEANLDIQYAASLGFKEKITYYSTGGLGKLIPDLDQPNKSDNQNEPYMEFLEYILKLDDKDLPQTITTSYGEDEQSVPEKYAVTICKMFAQLGLRGVSVLFSSGDSGVGSACQTNDGKNTTRFTPTFPGACPYITSVGGTYRVPERAVPFSSGGFSEIFPRPAYQEEAVKGYLSILGSRWDNLYNESGRGFPDISGQSYNFSVIERDPITGLLGTIRVGGTSASSPSVAAIIALLNNARLQANQPPLGFLNPWLYSTGKAGLNNITLGGSTGCSGTDIYSGLPAPYIPYASWNATVGWDPVTGLGTPDFKKLLQLSTPNNRLPHIGNCGVDCGLSY